MSAPGSPTSPHELNLHAWLGAADVGFDADLDWIEKHMEIEFDIDVHSDDMATRSKELHQFWLGFCATVP